MKTDFWMPLYWGDLLADTLHLNRSDFGSYVLLIGAYWRNGGPLPDDNDQLRTITRCHSQEWSRTKGILSEFFTLKDGLWHHKRIDLELQKAQEGFTRRYHQTAAARAANPKHTRIVTNPVTNPVTTGQPEPEPEPQVQPETHTHTPSESERVFSQKREFELDATIDYLTAALFKAYNRDPNRRLCNSEEPLIAEVARRPGAKRECDRILNWKSTIPPKELRYFPQSIERLLQAWSATLDKADAQLTLGDSKAATPKSIHDLKTVLEAKQKIALNIKSAHCRETGLSSTWDSENRRLEYATIAREIVELNRQIARCA